MKPYSMDLRERTLSKNSYADANKGAGTARKTGWLSCQSNVTHSIPKTVCAELLLTSAAFHRHYGQNQNYSQSYVE